jgi:hypothetical protein
MLSKGSKYTVLALSILTLIALGYGFYDYSRYQETANFKFAGGAFLLTLVVYFFARKTDKP